MLNTGLEKDAYCRVCEHAIEFLKCIRGEESGREIPLYKCKKCSSFYSRMDYLCQKPDGIRKGSIEDYLSNEEYVKDRVEDILLHARQKQWVSGNGNKLLDIGCGVGWSLVVAKERGFRAYGVEPVTEASRYANDTLKLDVINALFRADLFTHKDFDFIIMDQVLEHVPNPAEMLGEACHLLKPGGILFLAVPPVDWSRLLISMSFQFPPSIMEMVNHNRHTSKFITVARKYDTFCFPEGHINYFSAKAISIFAQKCNAQVIEQYHAQKIRAKYFPFLKLSTGSFFLRKH